MGWGGVSQPGGGGPPWQQLRHDSIRLPALSHATLGGQAVKRHLRKKMSKKKQRDFQNKQIHIQKKSFFQTLDQKKQILEIKKKVFFTAATKKLQLSKLKKKKKKNSKKFVILSRFGKTTENILSHNKIEFFLSKECFHCHSQQNLCWYLCTGKAFFCPIYF